MYGQMDRPTDMKKVSMYQEWPSTESHFSGHNLNNFQFLENTNLGPFLKQCLQGM